MVLHTQSIFIMLLLLGPCLLSRVWRGQATEDRCLQAESAEQLQMHAGALMQIRVQTRQGSAELLGSALRDEHAATSPPEGLTDFEKDYISDADNPLDRFSSEQPDGAVNASAGVSGGAGAAGGTAAKTVAGGAGTAGGGAASRASAAGGSVSTMQPAVTRTPGTSAPAPASGGRCVTRKDSRAVSWGYTTAVPGTPCFFGADIRDEGVHCIMDGGKYGSFGWCWTSNEKNTWGSCGEDCPLFGPDKVIAKEIKKVKVRLDKVLKMAADIKTLTNKPTAAAPEAPPRPAGGNLSDVNTSDHAARLGR